MIGRFNYNVASKKLSNFGLSNITLFLREGVNCEAVMMIQYKHRTVLPSKTCKGHLLRHHNVRRGMSGANGGRTTGIRGRFAPPIRHLILHKSCSVLSSELQTSSSKAKPATSVHPYHIWVVYMHFSSSSTSDISCLSI